MHAINEPAGLALIAGDGDAPHNLVPVHHHRATSHLLLPTLEGLTSRPLKEQERGEGGKEREREREGGRREGGGGRRERKEREGGKR